MRSRDRKTRMREEHGMKYGNEIVKTACEKKG